MSDATRRLCDEVQTLINERRKPRYERTLAHLEHDRRRAAVIERHRSKIIDAAMAKLGIDAAEIKRLQQDDTATLKKFLDSQRAALEAEAAQVISRRQRLIKELRTRRFEYKAGNPFTLWCNWNASHVNVSPVVMVGNASESSQVVLGPKAGENSVESSLTTQYGDAWVDADFHFPWDNTTGAGWLEVYSWVYAWGGYRLLAPADCFGGNFAAATVRAWMALFQQSPNGAVELGVTQVSDILNKEVQSDSSWGHGEIGASGSPTRFSDYVELTHVVGVPITAGNPVDVVVTVHLTLDSSSPDEQCSLDCTTGSWEINVPSVWMVVHTGEIPQP